jgi:hypothetical protein
LLFEHGIVTGGVSLCVNACVAKAYLWKDTASPVLDAIRLSGVFLPFLQWKQSVGWGAWDEKTVVEPLLMESISNSSGASPMNQEYNNSQKYKQAKFWLILCCLFVVSAFARHENPCRSETRPRHRGVSWAGSPGLAWAETRK